MKLYKIPRESRIYTEYKDGSFYITFKHLDGAYSFCLTEKNNIAYLSVNTELEKISDKEYKIC